MDEQHKPTDENEYANEGQKINGDDASMAVRLGCCICSLCLVLFWHVQTPLTTVVLTPEGPERVIAEGIGGGPARPLAPARMPVY